MAGVSALPIWPAGSVLSEEDGVIGMAVRDGETAALVGDHVRLSRATISFQEAEYQGFVRQMVEECTGPYVLVGDEVTAFDLENEPTELRLQEPDVDLSTGKDRFSDRTCAASCTSRR